MSLQVHIISQKVDMSLQVDYNSQKVDMSLQVDTLLVRK
jgi:hypothetical protein